MIFMSGRIQSHRYNPELIDDSLCAKLPVKMYLKYKLNLFEHFHRFNQ